MVFGHGNCSPIHLSHHALSELFSIAKVLHVAVRLTTACPLMRMILFGGRYVCVVPLIEVDRMVCNV